jgi:hypothetical protein
MKPQPDLEDELCNFNIQRYPLHVININFASH